MGTGGRRDQTLERLPLNRIVAMTRRKQVWLAGFLAILAVIAISYFVIGDDTEKAEAPSAGATSEVSGLDSAAAAAVPAAIKRRGSLTVPMATFYPPNEFLDADGKTIVGMGPDLARALGERMDLRITLKGVEFDTILSDLVAGDYDMAISSFTITDERKGEADMVSYFRAGSGFFSNADARTDIAGIEDLCGKSVAVASGVVQVDDAEKQSEECVSNGDKPVEVVEFDTQAEAVDAVRDNEVQLGIADSPVAAYLVKESGGTLAKVGEDYGLAPYGVLVNQDSGLTDAVQLAMQSLIDDGSYTQILERWGQGDGAVTRAQINP